MKSADVINLYKLFERENIKVWLDGGWGVDALLQKETRPHGDLDIVIQKKDVPKMLEILKTRSYKQIKLEEARPHNFVLGDGTKEIDVHVIELDEEANGIYGPVENGDKYPAQALTGKGIIDDVSVNCLSPEYQVVSHTGYEIDEKDIADVMALHDKFGVPLPEEYKRKEN